MPKLEHRSRYVSTAQLRAAVMRRARAWRDAGVDLIRDARLLFGTKPAALQEANARRRILVVDDLVPDPRFGAGYPRAAAIIQAFLRFGYAVDCYPMESSAEDLTRMAATFGETVRFHRGEGAGGLRRLLWREGDRFDLLFVSRPTPMKAVNRVRRRGRGAVVYDAEAVLAPREALRRSLFGRPWSEQAYQAALSAELELARPAQAVTAVSTRDAAAIASVLDVPVTVLPHAVAVNVRAPGFAERSDVLFVGRLTGRPDVSPNVDSVLWFVRAVMPALDKLIGSGWRLHVAGLVKSAEIEALRSDRIVLHGVVEDLAPLYDRCRVFVAPTRYAAGIPIKVLEAMGQGVPCVVTPLLARQLAASPVALATGETPEQFAAACATLYHDDAEWARARAAGLAHVHEHASSAGFEHAIRAVLGRLLAP